MKTLKFFELAIDTIFYTPNEGFERACNNPEEEFTKFRKLNNKWAECFSCGVHCPFDNNEDVLVE